MYRCALPIATLVIFLSVAHVDSLLCYQCATTSPDSHECKDDVAGLENTSLGLTDKYFKNCTEANVNWTLCMILTSEGAGGVQTFFHRGCHDGVTFSKLHEHPRFKGLPPNNQTTCARITTSRESVCFTFCDKDFCNGPQPPEVKEDPLPCDANSTDVMGCGALGLRGTMMSTGVLAAIQICALTLFLGFSF